jgi:WD40 repeat protein/energy-coupling factor transporter ATP-binding protein EcfA2
MASKSVLINLGSGDLHDGFPRVTAQLWDVAASQGGRMERSLPEQYVGSLPAAPQLVRLYRNWQTVYQGLCNRFQVLMPLDHAGIDDALEIEEGGTTNVSQFSFEELCQQFQSGINDWLRSESFLNIDRQVRSQLDPTDEIRVIIATNDELLRRLPWQQWEFFRDYPRAEMALARPEYKRRETMLAQRQPRTRVRVLAILGDTQDIDLAAESHFLHSLPDADVELLVNPSRPEFTMKLWDGVGWDILFFAGHSCSEGETGRIYLNDEAVDNSLTIEQLEEALKTAVENGLQLAIFNSCDGLGLAIALEKLHTPVAIVMREPVPNRVAQAFFKHFMAAFAIDRLSLYLSVQQARRKLQGLESEFPGASWLPAICQNPAIEPPTWLRLGGLPPCPYSSLVTLAPGALLAGREAATRDLVTAVQKKPLVAIVGASGSGKSSLVNAGLIPKLTADQALILSIRPGHNPLAALAAVLTPYCGIKGATPAKVEHSLRQPEALGQLVERVVQHSGQQMVLIVESFEDLYRLCPEPMQRLFLERLLAAVRSAPGFTVLLVLRSDFYQQAIAYSPLGAALQEAVQWLNPMSREELQRAIEQPAAQVGVQFEKGLSEKVIQDLGDADRLPVLGLVLSQLWTQQQQGWLTHQAYEEMGGVEKIMTYHAETVYAQLNEGDRRRAQRLLTQFVNWNQGAPTARVATRTEVKPEHWDLVTRLATARLLQTQFNPAQSEPCVAIAHDVLIQSWGRLEHWMQVNGEFRRWQEQVRTAMRAWQAEGDEELLQGKLLETSERWRSQRSSDLSEAEQRFIELSRKRHRQHIKRERRRFLMLKLLLGLMSLAFLVAVGLGVFAYGEYRHATEGRIEAIAARSDSLFDLNQRLDALSQAVSAKGLLQQVPWGNRAVAAHVQNSLLQSVYGSDEVNRLPPATAIAISPNGQWIATASEGKIHLWQQNGELVKTLSGDQSAVESMAFNARSQLLASASAEGTARIWQLNQGSAVTLKGHSAAVKQVVFSSDGGVATASVDGTVKLWNSQGQLLRSLEVGTPVTGVAFSPNGKTLAASTADKIELWRMAAGNAEASQSLAIDQAHSLAFSADGQTLVASDADHELCWWKRDRTGGFAARPAHIIPDASVSRITFSPNGKTLAAISPDQTIQIWDREGHLVRTLKGHTQPVADLAFSPDGRTLVTSGGDQTRLWQLQNPAVATLNAQAQLIAYRPDNQLVASIGAEGVIKLWKANGVLHRSLENPRMIGNAIGLAFSRDGKTVASATESGTVQLWQVNLKTKEYELSNTFNTGNILRMSLSPQGRQIGTTTATGSIQLWSPTGVLQQTLTGHSAAVRAIAFSPTEKSLLSGSDDGSVKIWQVESGSAQSLKGATGSVLTVAFSPDGETIAAAGGDRTVYLWSRRDGSLIQSLQGHKDEIRSLEFSADNQHLATASTDQTIKLWKLEGKELAMLKGNLSAVESLAFSPSGERLATVGENGWVKLWKLDLVNRPKRLTDQACTLIKNYLTQNQEQTNNDWVQPARQACNL